MSAKPLSPEHTAVLRRGVDVGSTVTPTAGKQTIHLVASDSAGCPAFETWALSTGGVIGCGVDVGSVHAMKLECLAYRRLMRSKRKPGAMARSTCRSVCEVVTSHSQRESVLQVPDHLYARLKPSDSASFTVET